MCWLPNTSELFFPVVRSMSNLILNSSIFICKAINLHLQNPPLIAPPPRHSSMTTTAFFRSAQGPVCPRNNIPSLRRRKSLSQVVVHVGTPLGLAFLFFGLAFLFFVLLFFAWFLFASHLLSHLLIAGTCTWRAKFAEDSAHVLLIVQTTSPAR